MSIEISFPQLQHQAILSSYDNQKVFKKLLKDLCMSEYGPPDAFVYTLCPTINNQWHTWKCTCEASLIYQKDETTDQYILKDVNAMHNHKADYFQFFDHQKLRKRLGQTRNIIFPNNMEELQSFEDQNQIISTFESQWNRQQMGYVCGFFVKKMKDEGTGCPEIVFQCRYNEINFLDHTCEWKIVYRYDSQTKRWMLNLCNPYHQHYIIMQRKDILRPEKNDTLGKGFNDLGTSMSFPMHKYGQRFIDGYNKVFQQPTKPLYEILKMGLKAVRKYHMEIRYKNRNQLLSSDNFVDIEEDLLVISSKMMKFMSKSYGRVVYMKKEKLYQNQNLINEQTQKKIDVYSLVTFYGFNHGYSIVVFGFAVIRNFTTEKGVRILDKFRNNYLHTLEALIASEDDPEIKKVIEEYPTSKKTFHTCIRSFPKNQTLSHFINDSSKEYLEVEVQKYLMIGQDKIGPDIINDQSSNNWFTSYSECFLGLDFSLGGLNQLQEEDVRNVAGSSNINTFEYQLQHLIREANDHNIKWYMTSKEKSRFEVIFMGRDDIKKCRLMMGKIPFSKLIQQLLLVPLVTVLATDSTTFYLIGDESYPYIVHLKNDKWLCQCEHSIKTGIPCVHELKVLWIRDINIFEGINMFWIMDQAIINLQLNPQKANNPAMSKRKRRIGRRKLIA